jgi:hypothetical protein
MYTDILFMVYINAWGKSRDCAWIRQITPLLLSISSLIYPHLCATDGKQFEVLTASQNKTTENIWWEESRNITYYVLIAGWLQGALFFFNSMVFRRELWNIIPPVGRISNHQEPLPDCICLLSLKLDSMCVLYRGKGSNVIFQLKPFLASTMKFLALI